MIRFQNERFIHIRTIILCAALLFLHISHLYADPVSNVRYYHISDNMIIIYYDVTEPGKWNVSVEVSLDGGKSFSYTPRALSGDVGESITSGTFKRIAWDISQETVEISEDTVIRVVAVDITEPGTPFQEGMDRTVHALQITTPVIFDGLLTEPFWEKGEPATQFTQKELVEGEPATEKTEIKIVYNNDNLYIGVMCYDTEPEAIIHNELQRDVELTSDDNVTIVLDTFHAKRNGYFFEINPNGARYDGFFYGTELINTDWDGVWDTAAQINEQGWSAEIVIPFKTLRFPNTGIQVWGINFRRIIRRKNEEVLWSSWRRDDGIFQLTKSGKLLGLESITKGKNIEFRPYVLTGLEETLSAEDREFKYGIDIRYPLTSGLTLDATTYTDFAQVETDKERINLTRFSLFYPEKRDFFLEGSDINDFDTGYFEKVYHSRRIGISPQREQIPILGGLNLIGRAGHYSLGVLSIQTDKKGLYPSTNYTVVRVKRDVLEKSRIGFIATNLYDENKHTNRTFGADFFYQTNRLFTDKNFGIRGDITGSFTDGRHDDNLFGRLFIDYPNDLFDNFVELYHVGKQFNPEIGFITRTGVRRINGAIRFFPRPPLPLVNKFTIQLLRINYIADTSGKLLERNLKFWPFGILTTSDDLLRFEIDDSFDNVDTGFTIFGDVVIPRGIYRWRNYGVYIESNKSRPLSLTLTSNRGTFYSGDRDYMKAECAFKLSKYIAVLSDIEYNGITIDDTHFITREYGGKLHLNMSTKLTTSTFIQYNNETREVNMNFRLHYLPNMGSDLYFVYNHLWDESLDYTTKYRTGIFKLDYLLRF